MKILLFMVWINVVMGLLFLISGNLPWVSISLITAFIFLAIFRAEALKATDKVE